jgi:hypothetical protein
MWLVLQPAARFWWQAGFESQQGTLADILSYSNKEIERASLLYDSSLPLMCNTSLQEF